MASIELDHVGVEFSLFSGKYTSFRSRLLNSATGGRLARDPAGRVSVRALEDISLTIKEGERVGLLGPNGAGKSTLLRVLSGVYQPTSGSARIFGSVGTLIDISLGINPEATGKENIFLRGMMLGLTKAEVRAKLDEVVDFSELGDYIDMPVRTYSSGMQMRLAFSVSTVVAPEILIMDEWLSVGDEAFKHKAEQRLADMVDQSSILVIASHSRTLLEKVCDRGILLGRGTVVTDKPIGEVCDEYFQNES